uniref:Uncharacterized protein n=1 Tax=Pithovirus LCDPAC01 TaxID=2506600 RepID=A0A481YP59_9VIRU|nr:MAG: hypothetical protein LCDPAC01_00730 [Pithovirus LCDPAC01]
MAYKMNQFTFTVNEEKIKVPRSLISKHSEFVRAILSEDITEIQLPFESIPLVSAIKYVISRLAIGVLRISRATPIERIRDILHVSSWLGIRDFVDQIDRLLKLIIPKGDDIPVYFEIFEKYFRQSKYGLRNVILSIHKGEKVDEKTRSRIDRVLERSPESPVAVSYKKYGSIIRVNQEMPTYLIIERYRPYLELMNIGGRHEVIRAYMVDFDCKGATITFNTYLPVSETEIYPFTTHNRDSDVYRLFVKNYPNNFEFENRIPQILDPSEISETALKRSEIIKFPPRSPFVYLKGNIQYPYVGYKKSTLSKIHYPYLFQNIQDVDEHTPKGLEFWNV